jgi:hypothetical protein
MLQDLRVSQHKKKDGPHTSISFPGAKQGKALLRKSLLLLPFTKTELVTLFSSFVANENSMKLEGEERKKERKKEKEEERKKETNEKERTR